VSIFEHDRRDGKWTSPEGIIITVVVLLAVAAVVLMYALGLGE